MVASDSHAIEIVHDVASLRARLADWRRAGETIGLVPTMGALHAGHMSLVEEAKKHARRIVLSIFVNPTQFAPSEDFAAYPRTLAADAAKFAAAGGDLVFAPAQAQIYPPDFATMLSIERPGDGGARGPVPADSFFRRRDHRREAPQPVPPRCRDLWREGLSAAESREANGPRSRFRNVDYRARRRCASRMASRCRRAMFICRQRSAPPHPRFMRRCAAARPRSIEGGAIETALDTARKTVAAAGFAIDYVEARHAETLAPVASREAGPVRLLAAATLGKTRLIDNVGLESAS